MQIEFNRRNLSESINMILNNSKSLHIIIIVHLVVFKFIGHNSDEILCN
jgi:hypothetical protein